MKKNYFIAAVVALIGLQQSQAQFDKYYPGQVTTITGEVLEGEVLKIPEEESLKVIFYRDANNLVTKYDVSEIDAYKRGREVYQKKAIGTSQVLMKQLIEGDVTLYKHAFDFSTVKNITQTNVMLKGAGKVVTSKGHVKRNAFGKDGAGAGYYLEKDGELTKVNKRSFRSQMKKYFAENEDVISKIKSRKYKFRDLVKVVRLHNS